MAIEIVSFPIENGGSFHSYVKLPEGNEFQQCRCEIRDQTNLQLFFSALPILGNACYCKLWGQDTSFCAPFLTVSSLLIFALASTRRGHQVENTHHERTARRKFNGEKHKISMNSSNEYHKSMAEMLGVSNSHTAFEVWICNYRWTK